MNSIIQVKAKVVLFSKDLYKVSNIRDPHTKNSEEKAKSSS